jgi:DNA-binding protein H-NS
MKNRRTQEHPLVDEPTQTLKEIDQEIARLKERAATIITSEKSGVIERIKEAIAYYGITAAELGFGGAAKPVAPVKSGRSAKEVSPSKRLADTPEAAVGPVKKPRAGAGLIKYKDDAGNAWSGFGPKPRWFAEALAGGKTPEDLKA